jgi:crossover junction endodeoxyribonuclease RuvC
MIVLGIDPGLASTGYGVVACRPGGLTALAGGVVETNSGLPQERRLADIHAQISELVAAHHPDALALEDLYFGQNVRTAFAVGHARGVVRPDHAADALAVAICHANRAPLASALERMGR